MFVRHPPHLFFPSILLLCLLSIPGQATTTKTTAAHFTTEVIEVDGHARENAWSQAVPLGAFSVFAPTTDVAPRFAASGKILSDTEALYFFIHVKVPKENLSATLLVRDKPGRADRIEIHLDPYGRGRRGYSFVVTPAGVLADGLISAEREQNDVDRAWDSLFDARTHLGEESWTAEIRIPYESLRFREGTDRFNAHIFVHGWKDQQSLSWVPIDRDATTWIPQMGTITGLKNPEPGRSIELIPSFTMGWKKEKDIPLRCDSSPGYGGNFRACGVDATVSAAGKWAITPSNTMDLSFNPDFSQIEADPRRLEANSRFALQLQERRPFFLEGIDLFQVSFRSLGLLHRRLEMVYTRSINQPLVAGKFTGRQGNARYGAFIAYDQSPPDSILDEGFSPSTRPDLPNLQAMTTVARTTFDLGSKASIGALFVDKEFFEADTPGAGSQASNQMGGLDAQVYLTPQFSAESALFFSHARDFQEEESIGYASRARLLYRQDRFRIQSHYERLSPGFRSEAGYIPRVGFHNFFNKMDFFYRSESDWARVLSPGMYASVFLDESGTLDERIVGFNNYWKFGNQIIIFPKVERIAERIDERWLDTTLSSVSFSWRALQEFELMLHTNVGDTVIREELRAEDEKAYVGWTVQPMAEVIVRPTSALTFIVNYARGLVYRHYGSELLADEPVLRGTTQYFFTRDLHLRNIIEWDDYDKDLSADLLFTYHPTPATLFFIGYRESLRTENALRENERRVFLKFSYLFSV